MPTTIASPAESLRRKADALQLRIDSQSRPMTQNPTPKRNREYQARLIEAERLKRIQAAFHRLADAWDAGTVPDALRSIKTTAQADKLLRTEIDTSGGYYSIRDTGKYRDTSEQARQLQALIDSKAFAESLAERKLESEIADILLSPPEGFFPTPRPICERLIELADIQPGHRILEPSAGTGHLADVIEELAPPTATLRCGEIVPKLREILEKKGYPVVASDFLEHRGHYDRIIQNPPFERGQDIDHIRHAYSLLDDGGRLVSVCSAGPFFRTDKKSTAFREWLEALVATVEDLPRDAFTGPGAPRQTSVSTCIVVVDQQ